MNMKINVQNGRFPVHHICGNLLCWQVNNEECAVSSSRLSSTLFVQRKRIISTIIPQSMVNAAKFCTTKVKTCMRGMLAGVGKTLHCLEV